MRTLRGYLQLVRLPAVFTAMADIVLGYLLNHRTLEPAGDFAILLAASSALYLAGMALNDVFDRRIDAEQRPSRPIPSGRVSLRGAVLLAVVLMLAGIVATALVGTQSLLIGVALAACILLYDGILKGTVTGPIAMGGCRFLNVMLGASAHAIPLSVWSRPQTLVAAALGIYVVGLTWFARTEAMRSRRGHLLSAAATLNAGLLALLAILWTHPWRGEPDLGIVVAVFAVVYLTINTRVGAAIADPVPGRVQAAVGTMILSLVMLDATVVLAQTGSPAYAVATASLVVPAILLRRWMAVT